MRHEVLVPALLGLLAVGCPGPEAERTDAPTNQAASDAAEAPAETPEPPAAPADAEPTAAAELPTLRYYELPG